MSRFAKILAISRIAKKTGNNGLSKKDQEKLFNALVKDITTPPRGTPPQRGIKKSNLSNFTKVAEEIMGDNPQVTKSYTKLVEKWIEPYSAGQKQLIFSQYQSFSQTAWFRSLTNDYVSNLQGRGVTKVQILAYMDDRTTEICQAMHGRVFDISSYSIDPDFVTYEKIESMGYGSMPTKDMKVMLPPYHFNCRTTFVTYEEATNDFDKIKQKIYDVESLTSKDVKTIMEPLKGAEWLNKSKESQHYQKHGIDQGLSREKYKQQIIDSLQDNDNMYLAVNKGNKNLTLTTVKYHHLSDKGVKKYLFTIFLVKEGKVVTSHLKPENEVLPKVKDKAIKVVSINNGKQRIIKEAIMKKEDYWNRHNSYDSIIAEVEDNKKWGNYPLNCLVTWYQYVPSELEDDEDWHWELDRSIPARYDIHILLMNDYNFTQEERNLIERTDKKLLDNIDYYFKKIKVISPDELAEFLIWLQEAREAEKKEESHTKTLSHEENTKK